MGGLEILSTETASGVQLDVPIPCTSAKLLRGLAVRLKPRNSTQPRMRGLCIRRTLRHPTDRGSGDRAHQIVERRAALNRACRLNSVAEHHIRRRPRIVAPQCGPTRVMVILLKNIIITVQVQH
jgi:hypothetical protein